MKTNGLNLLSTLDRKTNNIEIENILYWNADSAMKTSRRVWRTPVIEGQNFSFLHTNLRRTYNNVLFSFIILYLL